MTKSQVYCLFDSHVPFYILICYILISYILINLLLDIRFRNLIL